MRPTGFVVMSDQPGRPHYHDYQPPRLYRTGLSLRRSYLTGSGDVQEGMMKALLQRFDERTSATTDFLPRPE